MKLIKFKKGGEITLSFTSPRVCRIFFYIYILKSLLPREMKDSLEEEEEDLVSVKRDLVSVKRDLVSERLGLSI